MNYLMTAVWLVTFGVGPSYIPSLEAISVPGRVGFVSLGAFILTLVAAYRLRCNIDRLTENAPHLVCVQAAHCLMTLFEDRNKDPIGKCFWFMRAWVRNDGKTAAHNVTASIAFFHPTEDKPLAISTRHGLWCDLSLDSGPGAQSTYQSSVTFNANDGRWCLDIAKAPHGRNDLFAISELRYYIPGAFDFVPNNPVRIRVVIRGDGLLEPVTLWFHCALHGPDKPPKFSQVVDRKQFESYQRRIPLSVGRDL